MDELPPTSHHRDRRRGGADPWLAFVAEIIVPASDDAADVVAASEFFVDALLATVRFEGESIAEAAERAARRRRRRRVPPPNSERKPVPYYLDYPIDWIGVPRFGAGEVFANPAGVVDGTRG